MRLSTTLAIAFHDGSVEFRDRITMGLLAQNNIRENVSGISEVGFEYTGEIPCKAMLPAWLLFLPLMQKVLHVALSPNFCAIVSLNDNTDVSLSLLQLPPGRAVDNRQHLNSM